MNRAIFLDRDGTINVDHGYLHNPLDLEFIEGSVEALARLSRSGYMLIIITNQSGIGRGYFGVDGFEAFNGALVEALAREGVKITDTFMCPHSPDEVCECRKPQPFMVQRAIEKYNIDPTKSFMLGDKSSDVECGVRAGVRSFRITEVENLLYWATCIIEEV